MKKSTFYSLFAYAFVTIALLVAPGLADAQTTAAPVITLVWPSEVSAGGGLTVTGSGFLTTGTAVYDTGLTVPTALGYGALQFCVPRSLSLGTHSVKIVNANGTSNALSFNIPSAYPAGNQFMIGPFNCSTITGTTDGSTGGTSGGTDGTTGGVTGTQVLPTGTLYSSQINTIYATINNLMKQYNTSSSGTTNTMDSSTQALINSVYTSLASLTRQLVTNYQVELQSVTSGSTGSTGGSTGGTAGGSSGGTTTGGTSCSTTATSPDVMVTVPTLNVRYLSPSTGSFIIATLTQCQKVRVLDSIYGQSIEGNNLWWRIDTNRYIWSGGTTPAPTVPLPAPDVPIAFWGCSQYNTSAVAGPASTPVSPTTNQSVISNSRSGDTFAGTVSGTAYEPTITSMSATHAPCGTFIRLVGTNFGITVANIQNNTVEFYDSTGKLVNSGTGSMSSSGTSYVSPTEIIFSVPNFIPVGAGYITVTNNASHEDSMGNTYSTMSKPYAFTIDANPPSGTAPTITKVVNGTIYATQISTENTVMVGNLNLPGRLNHGPVIQFDLPSGTPAGTYDLRIKNQNGTSNAISVYCNLYCTQP